MTKEIRLIKEAWALANQHDPNALLFIERQGRTREGDYIFLIHGPGIDAQRYVYPRYDVTPWSAHKGLSLDAEFKLNPALLNKDSVAAWVNRHVNVDLLPSDVGTVFAKGDRVTVVIAPNSMRFKHSFSMVYQ